MIVGNKMHNVFSLPGIEFPLAEEVPIASEEGCHCQKKREATARKIALLSKSRRNCQSKSNDSFTKRVPYDQRNNPPQHLRVVYPPILDINHFHHFLVTLENLYPIDDEPMWAADCIVALTFGSAINIPETANEFAIKGNHLTLVKADLGASINLMPYSLYAKLSLETLKSTKMSMRLADRSFQYLVGIAKNMLVKVGKFTFLVDFVILEMEEDSKVPLTLRRPFLHTADAVIRVKQKQLKLGVGTEQMIFNIDSSMKYSYSNDDTCFSIDVIDEILEEDFNALLDEGIKILHSIEGTLLEEGIFTAFDEFMSMIVDINFDSEFNTEEPPF
uniref:Reverse transcriptase domain-containing protein n=1 Tax=Tanacetum cinerariifolium TaxID=118510 RepID=A0A699GVG8_TANCI|nr:reverse transcriptase domain-containing protein [Tanacetum cinerariifolium]